MFTWWQQRKGLLKVTWKAGQSCIGTPVSQAPNAAFSLLIQLLVIVVQLLRRV